MVVLENFDGYREKSLIVLDCLRREMLAFKIKAIVTWVSVKYLKGRVARFRILALYQVVKFLNHPIENKVRLLVFLYYRQRLLHHIMRLSVID